MLKDYSIMDAQGFHLAAVKENYVSSICSLSELPTRRNSLKH